jgi:putative transposase
LHTFRKVLPRILECLSLALALVSSVLKSRAALQLENIALRHQIGVLQRSAKKRLPLNNADRLLWIGLSRVWTEWRSALKILKPDTVIGSHLVESLLEARGLLPGQAPRQIH